MGMDDASLDDFLDEERREPAADDGTTDGAGDDAAESDLPDQESEAIASDDHEGRATDEESADVDPDGVAPPSSTLAVSPEPTACEGCGEPVRRRWRDGDRLVCHACKEW